jgi:putative spermidine/putrescine transport system substrate-binding protein/spermidine/putrescine transport system substrate-binding protein
MQGGLRRVRVFGTMTRRGFMAGTAGVGLVAASGGFMKAHAATNVTFVGWQGYDTPLADYAAAHDAVIDATYIGDSNQIISKLQSGGVGTVDIVTPNATYVPLLVKLDTLMPLDESKLSNLPKVIPFFLNNPSVRIDGNLYAVPYVWGGVPMMYDPAAVTEKPDSWNDVLKPEYAGKVVMLDNLNNIQLAARVATDTKTPTRLTHDELVASVDFLIKVKAQSRVIAANYGEMTDAMARGEAVISFNGWEVMVSMAQKKDKEIAYVYPKEGTFGWCDCYCVVKDAPNADLAHHLANEAISVPVQTSAGVNDLLGIVNTDAIAALPPETKSLYAYDDIDGFSQRVGFFPVAPLEPEGDIATFDDWKNEYLRFKNA